MYNRYLASTAFGLMLALSACGGGGAGGGPFSTLESLFGGGAHRDRRRGHDIKVGLKLTLAEVASGTTKTVRIKSLDACPECAGTGARTGSHPVHCGTCGGSGRSLSIVFGTWTLRIAPCERSATVRDESAVSSPPMVTRWLMPASRRVSITAWSASGDRVGFSREVPSTEPPARWTRDTSSMVSGRSFD